VPGARIDFHFGQVTEEIEWLNHLGDYRAGEGEIYVNLDGV
jgi:hypothetical protein